MEIKTTFLHFNTRGNNHIIDITDMVKAELKQTELKEGSVLVSVVGSTAGVSTIEYEPGLVKHDLNEAWENLAPYKKKYEHNKTWGDDNGASHIRSTITGTSITLPFLDGDLILGTWQQIVFIDYDTQPRSRKLVVQVTGK